MNDSHSVGGPLNRSLTPSPSPQGGLTVLEPQHDGLTCTAFKEGILVLGGTNMRRVWRFSFRSLEWSCISVQGQFAPPGRLNHSTSLWGNCLLVTGGTTAEPEEYLTVYKLDLTSMRWSRLNTSVGVTTREVGYPYMSLPPLSRTHHASCTVGDKLYVQGGRPIYDNMSSFDMRVLQGSGFFEVLELDLNNNQWYPICHSNPTEYAPPPPLWGHTMVVMEERALVLFGGFEVDLSSRCDESSYSSFEAYRRQLIGEEGVDSDDTAPGMEMSNTVHIMGLRTSRWASFAPSVMDPSPEARALHVALMVSSSEMLILGGIGVSSSADVGAEVAPLANAWVWRVDSGVWRQLDPFPIEEGDMGMQGARLFSAVYQNQLVVSNDITAWNVLDISSPVEVRSMDGDVDVFRCAAIGMEDWQLVLSKAPNAAHNPLLQDDLVDLGGVLHPRRRRMISDAYESPLRRGKGPVDPKRADVVRLYDPFREGSSPRPREGQVNPILYALIAEK